MINPHNFVTYLEDYGIHVISFHGESIFCFVLKTHENYDLKSIISITNTFPHITFINLLSSIGNGYQYLFIK